MFSCDCCPCSLAAGAVLLFLVYKLFCSKKCCRRAPEILEKDFKKDVVYLYQFPRAATVPNMSPFCLKIEAFLRVHKIAYETRYSLKARSKYGLLPFIELNGEQIADSKIIEERLKKHFNIVDGSDYEESVARAVSRLVSHHTTKVVSKYRYIEEIDSLVDVFIDVAGYQYLSFLKPLAVFFIRRKATKQLKSFGLFSDGEFDMLLRKDFDALKGILGENKFFQGETPSSVDASLFGHFATWYYMPSKGYVARVLDQDYPSLVAWMERLKTDLFPTDFTRN